jgi:citronellol/citronellal dehydrogenase
MADVTRLTQLSRSISGRRAIITGAASGMGRATAHLFADEGARVVVADLGADRVQLVVDEIRAVHGDDVALGIVCDVGDPDQLRDLVDATLATFGGIDIVVNNASAIQLTPVAATDMRRYDLMMGINARGTFMVSKYALPFLAKAENPHILMLSPPLDMQTKWFAPHTAYSMAKFGMSLVVLGLAGEQRGKIAVNALWPRTTIATAAIKNLLGGDAIMRMSRKPEILADAAYCIFLKPKSFSGNFLIDDTFLTSEGVTDFDRYRVDPSQPLQVDFFVPDSMPPPAGVSLKALS